MRITQFVTGYPESIQTKKFTDYEQAVMQGGHSLEQIQSTSALRESVVSENFADGKNPGRKGLAKRSGVNCKASISSLRKTAKNSSGERARMAHWCANMKSGRAKNESEILEELETAWRAMFEAGVYKGYPCTKDCSGHAAGDRWADVKDITDPNDCPYSNNSFWEGCLAHTDEQE